MAVTVSFIVPTLNSATTLERCLASVRAQVCPGDTLELLIVDGGSHDASRDIAARFSADRILENPLRTGEAAKAVGLRHAAGEFVAFIDSDNELIGSDWLARMLAALRADPAASMAEPLSFHRTPDMPSLSRYCALMGLNDPVCYYTGNFDRWNYRLGRWTGLPVSTEACGDGLVVLVDPEVPYPTLGANGSVFRRAHLLELEIGDYYFDVDIPPRLARQGHRRFLKIRTTIAHHFSPGLGAFIRKQHRRITDYLRFRSQRERSAAQSYRTRGLALFVVSALLQFPCWWTAVAGWRRERDPAWFWHGPLCLLTLVIYASGALRLRR